MFQKKYWIYPVLTTAVIGLTGCRNTTESSFNTEESVPQAVKVEQVTEEEPVQVENTESTDDSQEDVSPEYTLTAIESLPEGQFQAERAFPDQNGYVDNTLAMNSMYSFEAFSGHGFLYFDVAKEIERFELFVNNHEVDTSGITPGFYELDISELAVNGTNTIQVSGVIANDPNGKVTGKIPYPIHVGITESGTAFSGNIKSGIGLGLILSKGIGDTIRVSLTGDVVDEVRSARIVLRTLGLRKEGIEVISCPTCGRTKIDLIGLATKVEEIAEKYPLNLKLAVMGCAVNGPGEAREADLGVAGGDGEGLLFKKGEIIKKVPESEILSALEEELRNWGR